MKNYLSSKLKDVLEAPLLLENNFTKLFDEFEIIEKNNIINSINSNKKINNIFLEDNNNNLNKEIFISFGKNKINNQDFSPIPILSSDSQKNKFSINSDKIQDNSLSPIPMNNLNLPIIKDINSHDSNQNYKNNIPPLFKKSDLNDLKLETQIKEIEFDNKNIISEYKWKKLGESLILNHIKDKKANFINNIPKIILMRLLVFNKKNELITCNLKNNKNNNNTSIDIINSLEKSTKIVTSTHIKTLSNNSLDDIADNSNIYNIDKENNEEKEYIYEPTNIQKILSANFEKIFDFNQIYSIIQQINLINQNEENIENSPEQNMNMFKFNDNLMFTIKEDLDEDIHDPESRNISMKNVSLKNNITMSKNNENKESLNQLNDIKEPNFKGINKFDSDKKENKEEIPDFSEFFKPEPTKMNEIELKINNKNDGNMDNNEEEKKNGNKEVYLFDNIISKERIKNNINDVDAKNSFSKLFNEPYNNFSFGKTNLNNNSYKNNIFSNEKNNENLNNNEINNNEIFTFDKKKNEINSQKGDFEDKNVINIEKNIDMNQPNNELINNNEERNNKNNIFNTNNEEKSNNINNEQGNNIPNFNLDTNKIENKKESPLQINVENNNIIENIKNKSNVDIQKDENQNYNDENIDIIKEIEKDLNNIEYNNKQKIDDKNMPKDENKLNNNNKKITDKEETIKANSNKEKESNNINKDEQIILNISDSIEGKKIEFNKLINSPEILSSIKSEKKGIDPNINIKSNLFNKEQKILSMNQLKILEKLYTNINLSMNYKNIIRFLKYFSNKDNCFIFKANTKDNSINDNIKRIKLKSYLNILNKISGKIINISDPFIKNLINLTSNQIEKIKREKNINNNQLKSKSKDISKEINNEEMILLFSNMNKKLKEIKNYYYDLIKAKKPKNNIPKLREDLKNIYEDIIRYINKVCGESVEKKIYCYQKLIDDLSLSKNMSNKNQSSKNNGPKKENKNHSYIINPLFIVGLLIPFLIIWFLIKFFI